VLGGFGADPEINENVLMTAIIVLIVAVGKHTRDRCARFPSLRLLLHATVLRRDERNKIERTARRFSGVGGGAGIHYGLCGACELNRMGRNAIRKLRIGLSALLRIGS
jgi:hypothetical protein